MKTLDDLVEALRQEIGLAPDDDTQDAWLTARAQAALAAMRRYCRRWLWPAAQFRDAFANEWLHQCHRCGGQAAVLAEIPVQEIVSVVRDGAPMPAGDFEALTTGRLLHKEGSNLAPVVAFSSLLVDYVAGYVDLPADLYEVIAGTVKKAWAGSAAGAAAGDALGGASKVTVFDVGSVEMDNGGAFYEGSVPKDAAAAGGPILGPWAAQLESYRDMGRGIGLPSGRDSRYVAPAPAPAAPAAPAGAST